MHYPVMTEKHLADRWQVSLKTLRRWRLDGEGPVYHKLFRQVRYHDADIIDFEQRSAQHLMTMLGITREFKPAEPEATLGQGFGAEAESHYFTAKEIAEAASLPSHLFRDQAERNRKRVPHAGREPEVFAARDPGMGDGEQCAWQRRCSSRVEETSISCRPRSGKARPLA